MRKIVPKSDKSMMDTPIKSSMEKDIYPSFRLELTHLPEAKKWKIGQEYEISMKVKMVGISQSRFQNDAEFEIKEIESEGSTEDESKEDTTKKEY